MSGREKLIEETRILESLHPSLTREEIMRISDKDISGYVFSKFDEFPSNERVAARLLEKNLRVKLRHFPKVDSPQAISSPDFAIPEWGYLVEIKEPSTARRGIEAAIRKAIRQILAIQCNLEKGIIVVCLDSITDAAVQESKEMAICRAMNLGVQNLIVIYKCKIIHESIKNKTTVR